MARQRFIMALGLLIAATPFSGFPEAWKAAFLALSGVGIAALSLGHGVVSKEAAHESAPIPSGTVAPTLYAEPLAAKE